MFSSMWPNCSQSLPSPSCNVRSSMVKVTWNMSICPCCFAVCPAATPQKKYRTSQNSPFDGKVSCYKTQESTTEIPVKRTSSSVQLNTLSSTLYLLNIVFALLTFGERVCETPCLLPPATWISCETDCLSCHASHKSQRAPNLHSPQEPREPR